MDLIQLPDGLEQKVQADYESLAKKAATLKVIKNKDDFDTAAHTMALTKQRTKRLEEIRKGLLKPIQDAVKGSNNVFKMMSEPFTKIEMDLRQSMNVYITQAEKRAAELEAQKRREEQERIKKAEAEAAKAKEKGEKVKEAEVVEKPVEVEAPDLNVRTEAGYAYTKKRWTFEVEDFDKVPKEYLIIDEKKINAEIRAGKREIKGIKIYQKSEVAIR